MELRIDIEGLSKGDVIPESDIREIVPHEDEADYLRQRAMWGLKVRDAVYRDRPGLVVRLLKDGLHVLRDNEASAHLDDVQRSRRRGL